VDVVGAGEPDRAAERLAEADRLQQEDRDDEPDERQPRHAREQKQAREERKRDEDEAPGGERERGPTRLQTRVGRDEARPDVGRGHQQRAHGAEEDEVGPGGHRRQHDPGEGRADPERERRPEPAAVEADRLRDELADCARLRRKRRRERRHALTVAGTSGCVILRLVVSPAKIRR